MVTNVFDEGRSEYFACFLAAVSSAAPSATIDVRWMYGVAHVCTFVTSQVMYLPADHGTNVEPSGRLPALRRGQGLLRAGNVCLLKRPSNDVIDDTVSADTTTLQFTDQPMVFSMVDCFSTSAYYFYDILPEIVQVTFRP